MLKKYLYFYLVLSTCVLTNFAQEEKQEEEDEQSSCCSFAQDDEQNDASRRNKEEEEERQREIQEREDILNASEIGFHIQE